MSIPFNFPRTILPEIEPIKYDNIIFIINCKIIFL